MNNPDIKLILIVKVLAIARYALPGIKNVISKLNKSFLIIPQFII